MDLSQVLSAEQSEHPTKLYFTYEGQCCHCLMAQRAVTGLLLCIPYNGIDVGLFHAAEEAGYDNLLGPYMESTVVASTPLGKPSKRLLDVIVFDFDMGGSTMLSATVPEDIDAEAVIGFGLFRGAAEWPHAAALRERIQEFLQVGGDRLEGYITAPEDAPLVPGEQPNGAGGADTQTLLEQLLSLTILMMYAQMVRRMEPLCHHLQMFQWSAAAWC